MVKNTWFEKIQAKLKVRVEKNSSTTIQSSPTQVSHVDATLFTKNLLVKKRGG